MAENKKSFVAYCDWGEIFDNLTNEEAGKLAKHLFNYVRDNNPKSDKVTNLLFIQIQQSLKRDLKKYEQYIDKQKINGAKGGRPKKPKKPKPLKINPAKPKKADNVNVNVNDSVNDNEEIYRKFDHLKITKEENYKLTLLGYDQNQIDDIYNRIENHKQNTKYKSLYFTSINWLKNEPKKAVKTKPKMIG